MDIEDIIFAIDFVSSDISLDNAAYLCKESGKIIYFSPEMNDSDEIPDDLDNSDKYIEIPTKHDLDLGASLAISFSAAQDPSSEDEVRSFFRKRGAYKEFKAWAVRKSLLEKWCSFEETRTISAVTDWLKSCGISTAN